MTTTLHIQTVGTTGLMWLVLVGMQWVWNICSLIWKHFINKLKEGFGSCRVAWFVFMVDTLHNSLWTVLKCQYVWDNPMTNQWGQGTNAHCKTHIRGFMYYIKRWCLNTSFYIWTQAWHYFREDFHTHMIEPYLRQFSLWRQLAKVNNYKLWIFRA